MQFLVNSLASAERALKYFNWFHDGMVTNVEVVGMMKMFAKIPFDPDEREDGEFHALGMGRTPSLRVVVQHNNYNCGEEPWNRAVRMIFPRCDTIACDVIGMVDRYIIECAVEERDGILQFSFGFSDAEEGAPREVLCSARRAQWSEIHRGGLRRAQPESADQDRH